MASSNVIKRGNNSDSLIYYHENFRRDLSLPFVAAPHFEVLKEDEEHGALAVNGGNTEYWA